MKVSDLCCSKAPLENRDFSFRFNVQRHNTEKAAGRKNFNKTNLKTVETEKVENFKLFANIHCSYVERGRGKRDEAVMLR